MKNVIKLLLIDDEQEVLNALKRLFRAEYYELYLASTGQDALDILADNTIDVVISDIRMPEMSGIDFLTLTYQQWPDVKRIVLTGNANMEDTLALINQCDVFRYFNKPWPRDELLKAVEQAAEQKCLQSENARLLALTQEQNSKLTTLNQQLDLKVKVSEQRLDKTNEKLQGEIIVEKELREARIGADKANEAKSRFLATMSHEIRSPLNSILVMNSLLLDSKLDHEQREHAKLAHQAGQMLLSLVNNILDFSKIESNQIELNEQWFDLADVVDTTQSILNKQAKIKNIQLIANIDDTVHGQFKGDPNRLKQILINLITNAIKFTEQGFVEITVFREESCHNLIIQIKDTGIGISDKEQNNIFNEFVQVEDSANRRFGGTGLGLSIVKRLVEKMRGVLTLSSQLGEGSTFTMALPLKFKAEKIGQTVKVPEGKKILSERLKELNATIPILVVEDSLTNVAVMKALLKAYDLDLIFAYNGQQAIDKARETAFSVILMDMSMPIMDGLDATRWIRANPNLNMDTPIVAMTANSFTEDKERCFAAGMNDFISKPIDTELFFRCLAKYIRAQPKNVENKVSVECSEHQTTFSDPHNLLDIRAIESLIRDITLESFIDILSIYKQETAQKIDLLNSLLQSEDWLKINNEAHALKSSSGSFGLAVLRDAAKKIEHAQDESAHRQAMELILNIGKLYKDSISTLHAYLNSKG